MIHKKKIGVLVVIAAIVILGTAATKPPGSQYRNLKILPQDISEKQLDSIMDTYCKALKVSCDFCHSEATNKFPLTTLDNSIDYALDNEMKEQARKMIRLTIDINKTYFYKDSATKTENINVITCNTCHRGNPYPAHE